MKKIIIGNWKMNPQTAKEALSLAKEIVRHRVSNKDVEIVLAPPFVFLEAVGKVLKRGGPSLGAQDVFWESAGAYTGEISPVQLKNLGVKYVIVGHSERRALGETDEMIARKLAAVAEAGMTPILCISERAQIDKLKESGSKALRSRTPKNPLIIAYEPLWAIGTGKNATPDEAAEMAAYIKVPVLYGGSVTSKNAADFLSREEIDGLLVGGASLNAEEFTNICNGA